MRILSFTESRNSLESLLDHVTRDADTALIACRDAKGCGGDVA